ncbi:overexpressed in colon carcinoma 1 protein homolog [Cyclopterus lumpus]|uniref:overexpressed in colon carcinoma 1 protein homolog n=1 Tax=Cyclopterus lumpus TaxID=8103 RepID=UPI001486262D|nr:overexpressed in colon carcinoma 1 protein homolog [Cyclopterus lumpus]
MGCGHSSPATSNNNNNNENNNSSNNDNNNDNNSSSSDTGGLESSSKIPEESVMEDDKWKNYGGVYVGFPGDLSNTPQIQIGPLKDHERDLSSLRRPLWGDEPSS